MKNYTYKWSLESKGCVELDSDKYTDKMKAMNKYIDMLSDVVAEACCGWDGVKYSVIKNPSGSIDEYMELYVIDGGNRMIPISGNSKGCNLAVLGENLW